jgi:hypothetical protein
MCSANVTNKIMINTNDLSLVGGVLEILPIELGPAAPPIGAAIINPHSMDDQPTRP